MLSSLVACVETILVRGQRGPRRFLRTKGVDVWSSGEFAAGDGLTNLGVLGCSHLPLAVQFVMWTRNLLFGDTIEETLLSTL